jgi:hypothetical protein
VSTLKNHAPLLVGLLLAAGVGYWGYSSLYAAPRNDLLQQINASKGAIAKYKDALKGEFDVHKRAKQIALTTLGGKVDTVEHRFRTGLSRIGEGEGLSGVVVDDGEPMDHTSPLLPSKGVATALKQALRKKPDFQTIRGTLKGTGSLEQVLRAVAVAQAQSWLHRVDGFSIKPAGGSGDKFELRMDVATLLVPDLLAGENPEPQIVQPPSEADVMLRAVAMKNVFKAPPAQPSPEGPREVQVAAAPAEGPAHTPPPQVFAPYDEWKLTGVVIGGRGAEAFFTNLRTNAKLTVEQGGAVLDAVFVHGEGEKAVMEIGGQRFEVSNGQTLAARKPV